MVLWLVLVVAVAIAVGAATWSSRSANPTAVGASINSRVGPISAVDAVRDTPGGVEVVGWALRTNGDGARPFVEITGNGELLRRARPDMHRHDSVATGGDGAIYDRAIEFLHSASCQIYVHQTDDNQWACPDY